MFAYMHTYVSVCICIYLSSDWRWSSDFLFSAPLPASSEKNTCSGIQPSRRGNTYDYHTVITTTILCDPIYI